MGVSMDMGAVWVFVCMRVGVVLGEEEEVGGKGAQR